MISITPTFERRILFCIVWILRKMAPCSRLVAAMMTSLLLSTPVAEASTERPHGLSHYTFIPYKSDVLGGNRGGGGGGEDGGDEVGGGEEEGPPAPYEGDITLGPDSGTPVELLTAEIHIEYDYFLGQHLKAADGSTPDFSGAQWQIVTGTYLPSGLELDAATGRINGIPFFVETETFEILVTFNGKEARQLFTIEVKNALLRATKVSAGIGNHTCAITTAGGAKCWGANGSGQLGIGNTVGSSTPKDVYGMTPLHVNVVAIDAALSHSCLVTDENFGYCWGSNVNRRVGTGNGGEQYNTPAGFILNASSVLSVRADHSCILELDGTQKCWGRNYYGQIGIARRKPYNTDTRYPNPGTYLQNEKYKDFSAGGRHSCGVTLAGGVVCVGTGYFGTGKVADAKIDLEYASGLSIGVKNVEAGTQHTCVLTEGGGVKCWGTNNYGQVGNNSTALQDFPVNVLGIPPLGNKKISTKGDHACVITPTDTVKCWGRNHYGQLGNGTTDDALTAVDVQGLAGRVIDISAGAAHTCVVMEDYSVKCWGYNYSGQLGDGTYINSSTPVDVVAL